MNTSESVQGSLTLTEALQNLAWQLTRDQKLSRETRDAASDLAKCLELMERVDTLIAVQT